MICNETLIALNAKGLFPGPDERMDLFEKRIEKVVSFSQNLEDPITAEDCRECHQITQNLFGFRADWIAATYSNKKLPLWQGAATWLYELDGYWIPLIQLKRSFKNKKHLGLYSRCEVLAHEAVHATRMTFKNSHFEEIFAYNTSDNFLRKRFGPLFFNSWESYFFVILLALSLPLQIFGYLTIALSLLLAPLGYWLIRLRLKQRIFSKCLNHLKSHFKDLALPLMLRLTDREIRFFSKGNDLLQYAENQNCLRWKVIKLSYL